MKTLTLVPAPSASVAPSSNWWPDLYLKKGRRLQPARGVQKNNQLKHKMKTLAELFAIASEINAAAKVETKANLLPPGSVASVCDENGSIDSETATVEGTVRLSIDIEMWRENARTYTDAGRAELAAEEAAAKRVLAVAAKHGRVEVDGSGSGQHGPITCYILA